MKRLFCLLACLLILPLAPIAQVGPQALILAEIELFNQALLERAIEEALPTFADAVGGYTVRGQGFELRLAGADLSEDSTVLSAALMVGYDEEGQQPLLGPRGSHPGMDTAQLLALFLNDNPYLAGTRDSAVLYMDGALPAATHTGLILRDGQQVQLAEYTVYYQAGGGVAQAGIQFTFDAGSLSAIRSFLQPQTLSQEEAAADLALLSALQEQTAYVAYGNREGSQLTREDFVLAGLDFFDAGYEAALSLFGQPDNEESMDDVDGSHLTISQWAGLEAVFISREAATTAQRLTATGGAFEGPRGLRLGDTLAQALSRFEHSGSLEETGGTLYGDAQGQVPPYGKMSLWGDSAMLYYVISAQAGPAGLILEFMDELLVSMTLTYL